MADVQEMAKGVGAFFVQRGVGEVCHVLFTTVELERFAELARAEERERCARIVERRAEERFNEHGTREYDTNACYYTGPEAGDYEVRDEEDEDCAAAIRAQEGK